MVEFPLFSPPVPCYTKNGMQKLPSRPPTVSSVEVPRYLFITECADMLRLTYKGMWSILASGDGPPYIKLRNGVRIPQDGFNNWLNSRTK